jgi:hypothetical protein
MLGSALAQAKELRLSSIAVTLGPHEFALSARSREGWWHLENRDAAVTIDEGPYLDGWAVGVQLRAMTLAAQSPADSAALAGDIASHVVHVIIEQRVRRIDLCADLAGFRLGRIDARQWVACGRAKARKLSPSPDDQMVEYFDGGKPVAFYVGKSAIVLRAYDKTVELQNDLVGEKRSAEHARWKLAGWNGTQPVDRVEFQVRGDAIKELDDGQLRDPDRFAARLDALWKHLTYKWLRLCVLDSASRRSRWANDPRWVVVQRVTFLEDTGEVARRRRVRGTPRAEYVAAIALSYAAKTGQLDEPNLPTPTEYVRWSSYDAQHFVRTTLTTLLGIVGEHVASKLLESLGPRLAAGHVIERLRAAQAKASTGVPCEELCPFDFFDVETAAE